MKTIDEFSYQCGVIDCFNEMIHVQVKQLALSHPLQEQNHPALLSFIETICAKYDTQYYFEESLLESSLFAVSNTSVYLFYKDEKVLQAYLQLKQCVEENQRQHTYTSEKKAEIAVLFAQLLSYPKSIYEKMILENQ